MRSDNNHRNAEYEITKSAEAGKMDMEIAATVSAYNQDPTPANRQAIETLIARIEEQPQATAWQPTADEIAAIQPHEQARQLRELIQQQATVEMVSTHAPNPPPVTWLVKGWMPDATLSVLTGEGGAGKSRIALQLAVAVATGQPRFLTVENANERLNNTPPPDNVTDSGPVVFAAWETRHVAFANRLAMICGSPGSARNAQIEALNNKLHYVNMRPYGGLWGSPRGAFSNTAGELLAGGQALLRTAASVKPRLIIIDPTAAAYAGNENDRTMVRAFLSHLDQFADDNSCAVLLIAHPPKSMHAQSGSTDWRNGVQAVWELATEKVKDDKANLIPAPSGARILQVDKLNEGPKPAPFTLAYKAGRFVAETNTQTSPARRPKQ